MENHKNMPVNKGNFTSFETEDRISRFERYRGQGWEKAYAKYREMWNESPKSLLVPKYPVQVDVEISNKCNLHCPMCFRGKAEFQKKYSGNKLLMEEALFKKILDEIGNNVPALRLSLRGEPTVHPQLLDFISYAKKAGIGEVSFLTNGSKLDGPYIESLIHAGLDWITVSIDGTGTAYEKIRKPLKFNETLDRIKNFRKIKQRLNVNKPVVKIQSVWPAIKEDPETYYNTFAPYVDLIAFNPLIDYLANDSPDRILYVENFICPQHYQRLVIGFDGKAIMCTNDDENTVDIGDANTMSIHDIWHGKKLSEIRNIHLKNGFKTIPVCKKCFLPRKTAPNETAEVNGRSFRIHNYINRSQNIGD